MKTFNVDKLTVNFLDSRDLMGKKAAEDIASAIVELQSKKDEINIIFAAAPSQNETLAHLLEHKEIEWSKINAFHMDEYLGLPADSPQKFAIYLDDHIFKKVNFKSVNYVNCSAEDIDAECERYEGLLKKYPTDIVILGIGENGHIAFNDPGVADFNDKVFVKKALLDDVCRNQQVNDGCFATIDDVPKYALTLTVPALMAGGAMFCSVPAPTKAWAVNEMLTAEINENCPATILRTHSNAHLYCDPDSSADYKG